MTWKVLKSSGFSKLPSCIYPLALKTTYGVIELGQHQFRQWLVAWRHQANAWTNVNLSVMEPCCIQVRTLSHEMVQEISISLMYWKINTLRPRQDGRHFPDDIFICIFLNENEWHSIKISLKFVPNVPINNIPALVQIMAWRRPGDKPLSEPMIPGSCFIDAYTCHSASMS